MHILYGFVGLSPLECNKSVRELAFGSEHVVGPKLHLKEVEDLVEMFFCFVVINGLDILDLVVYHRVQILFNDELFPYFDDFLEKSLCFDN